MSPRHVIAIAALALAESACAGPPSDGVFVIDAPPAAGFSVVSDALEARCGTLDCHGSAARNFRIYGIYGVRLQPNVTGNISTTEEEYRATYESLVAIQPEALGRIVQEHGVNPERWIVFTKGRGTEHHKGGTRMREGDNTDRCLTSWIVGAIDNAACTQSANVGAPDGGL
jgi:hypothetical protein